MKHEPVNDHAERKRILALIEQCEKEQTMNRYVDAEYVKAVMLNDRLMQGNAEFTLYAQQVETQVKALPSIDIVCCSECKHWRTYETWSECELWTDDPYESAKTKADDFCSYGCRKEE